jgi:hypothetical protein
MAPLIPFCGPTAAPAALGVSASTVAARGNRDFRQAGLQSALSGTGLQAISSTDGSQEAGLLDMIILAHSEIIQLFRGRKEHVEVAL